ncbi:two-component regulator propeller domain-containing protein [Hymenobacter coalescens]
MKQALRTALLSGLALAAIIPSARAQRTAGYGDWQLHLPTNRARVLADAGERVFAAAEDAFFVFDKQSASVQRLSRRDGLSDVGVRELAYDSLTQQVVVAYRSGQVDILNPAGRVVASLSDIKRKAMAGAKIIYKVNVARRLAFLSTNFGIVVLDLQRREIRDTYASFGPGGVVPQVYATTVLGDSLYAATSAGLLRGSLRTNLLDFNNWRSTPGFGARPGDPYRTLVTHQNKVYAGVNQDNLYRAVGANWVSLGFTWATAARECRSLRSSAAGLLVTEANRVTALDTRTNRARTQVRNARMEAALDAVRSSSGPLYVADYQNGLLQVNLASQEVTSFVANGPASANAFNILPDPASKTVTVFPGGYSEGYVQGNNEQGFSVFDADGRWSNVRYNPADAGRFPNIQDLSRGARTPDGTLYAASFGYGLLEWKGPGEWRNFVEGSPGSPLLSALPGSFNYTRLTDVATDPEGNVWVVNRSYPTQGSGVYRFTPATGQWQGIPSFTGSENLERITFDDLGQLWLGRARRVMSGMVAYDPKTNALRSFTETDGLPSGTVWDIAKDRSGAIWVATSAGAAVYDSPADAFAPNAPGFRRPSVTRGLGRGMDVLFSEVVRSIAVDGANRKWFGTDNGLWLFSEGADEGLLHFTTDNSPLPSNRVVDVAVDDRTGEVWVGTDAGLVSYRGSATVTEGKPSCAKVFPNPVRQDFSGQVGITGLANNAEVKITDVTGTLVYQTRATGGAVVWNLADYNGRRVQSGVYLVLTADADGQNGCISKVAVLTK